MASSWHRSSGITTTGSSKLDQALYDLTSIVWHDHQPKAPKTAEVKQLDATLSNHELLLLYLDEQKIQYKWSTITRILERTRGMISIPIISDFRHQWEEYKYFLHRYNSEYLQNHKGVAPGEYEQAIRNATFGSAFTNEYWQRCPPEGALRFPLLVPDSLMPLGRYLSWSEEEAVRTRYVKTLQTLYPPAPPPLLLPLVPGPKGVAFLIMAEYVGQWVTLTRALALERLSRTLCTTMRNRLLLLVTDSKEQYQLVVDSITVALSDFEALLMKYHEYMGIEPWALTVSRQSQLVFNRWMTRIADPTLTQHTFASAINRYIDDDRKAVNEHEAAMVTDSFVAGHEIDGGTDHGICLWSRTVMRGELSNRVGKTLSLLGGENKDQLIPTDIMKMAAFGRLRACIDRAHDRRRHYCRHIEELLVKQRAELARVRATEQKYQQSIAAIFASLAVVRVSNMLMDGLRTAISTGDGKMPMDGYKRIMISIVTSMSQTPISMTYTVRNPLYADLFNALYGQLRKQRHLSKVQGSIERAKEYFDELSMIDGMIAVIPENIKEVRLGAETEWKKVSAPWRLWPVYPMAREVFVEMAGSGIATKVMARLASIGNIANISGPERKEDVVGTSSDWVAPIVPLRAIDADEPITFADMLSALSPLSEVTQAIGLIENNDLLATVMSS